MRFFPDFRVDEIFRPLAREHAQGLFGRRRAHVLARFLRHAGKMRGQDGIVQRKQGMAGFQAVVLEDVEHRAGDGFLPQGLDQRVFLDHRAAADVDQPGRGFHL